MDKKYGNVALKKKKYNKTSRRSLTNLWKHLLRKHKLEQSTIDEKRKDLNEVLIGDETKSLNEIREEFFEKHNLKSRNRETVEAYQLVFSIPSEFINDKKMIDEFKKHTLNFINNDPKLKGNCLCAVLHNDEKQPHIQAVFVPMLDGKLAFQKMFGGLDGSKKISKLQDDFAKNVSEKLGLHRGDGTHTNGLDYQDYMRAVKEIESIPPEPEIPPGGTGGAGGGLFAGFDPLNRDKVKTLEEENKYLKQKLDSQKSRTVLQNQVKKSNSAIEKLKTELKEVKKNFNDLMKSRNYLKDRVLEKNKEIEEMNKKYNKDEINKLREIPLENVLERLGFEVKSEGNFSRYVKTENLNLHFNISNSKFTDNKSGAQGGGSFDLLMKVFNYDFNEARNFLAQSFGVSKVAELILANEEKTKEIVKEAVKNGSSEIPKPTANEVHIAKMYDYLTETRKVKKEIVNDLMKQGRLFANEYNGLVNCVFLNEDRNYAFLRGAGKKHYAGNRTKTGKAEFITFDFTNTEKTKKLYVFESCIDALCFRGLNPDENGVYFVTSGNAKMKEIPEISKNFDEIHICVDNDEQGKKYTLDLKSSIPNEKIKIHIPQGKDFGEDAKNEIKPTTTNDENQKLRFGKPKL